MKMSWAERIVIVILWLAAFGVIAAFWWVFA